MSILSLRNVALAMVCGFSISASAAARHATLLDDAYGKWSEKQTFSQNLESFKNNLAPEVYEFINSKLKELKLTNEPASKLIRKSSTSLAISYKKSLILFEILSLEEHQFKFNNHLIRIDKDDTIQKLWDKFAAALPASGSAARGALLLPQANAFFPLVAAACVATGGVVLAYKEGKEYCEETIPATLKSCETELRNLPRFSAGDRFPPVDKFWRVYERATPVKFFLPCGGGSYRELGICIEQLESDLKEKTGVNKQKTGM